MMPSKTRRIVDLPRHIGQQSLYRSTAIIPPN